jgi:hypothetical protein
MEVRKKGKIVKPEDYAAFNYFHSTRRLVTFAVLETAVFPLVLLLFYRKEMGLSLECFYLAALLLFAAVAGLFLALQLILIRVRSKRQYAASKALHAESELVANEAGVFETSDYGSTGFQWRDIRKAAEGKRAVYIYFLKDRAFIFPKRLFGAEDQERLYILAGKHLPPDKNHLKKRRL